MIIIGVNVMRETIRLHGGIEKYFNSENRTLSYIMCKYGLANTGCNGNREPLSLITTGYYAITRHPAYSGALLATLGLAAILGFPLISTIILYTWLYTVATIEEIELEDKVKEYKTYKLMTPRLAPLRLLIAETNKIMGYMKRCIRIPISSS